MTVSIPPNRRVSQPPGSIPAAVDSVVPGTARGREPTARPSRPSPAGRVSRPGLEPEPPRVSRPRLSGHPANVARPVAGAADGRGRPSLPGSRAAGRGAGKAPQTAASASARWLARFRLITGLIVVLSASVLVAWGLRRYLQSSPRFAIRTVQVEGNARRTARQIATLAGAAPGKNVFAVDLRVAEQSVESDSWVEHASVTRELPSTIRISVSEREARALFVLGGELFLVDGKGNAFKTLQDGDPSDLPVITGIASEQVAQDREGVAQKLRRMVDLLGELERVGIDRRFPVQEVRVAADDTVAVVIGTDAVTLELGRPPYRAKVEQADRILVEVARRKASPDVIFLDDEAHPERVVVRMR